MADKSSLKEGFKHGDRMFPMSVYHNVYDFIYTHWHPHLEILYVASGNIDLFVDFQKYEVKTDDIIIIPCESIHSAKTTDGKLYDINTIVVDLDLLQSHTVDIIEYKYVNPLRHNYVKFPIVIDNNSEIYSQARILIKEIHQYMNGKPYGYELFVKSHLYRLLALYFVNYKEDAEKSKKTAAQIEKVKNVINYINENYSKHITVEDVADYLHFSTSYFCRFFKKAMGHTFMDYLNNKRVEVAAHLLLNTTNSVTNVAYDVGFDDLSYFIRVFKKYNGVSPSAYRKKYNMSK